MANQPADLCFRCNQSAREHSSQLIVSNAYPAGAHPGNKDFDLPLPRNKRECPNFIGARSYTDTITYMAAHGR